MILARQRRAAFHFFDIRDVVQRFGELDHRGVFSVHLEQVEFDIAQIALVVAHPKSLLTGITG